MLTPIRKTGCICILLLSACTLSAQVERGTISGTVHDATGAIVAGAAVTVTNVNTSVPVSSITNQSGEYVAPNLIPGEYSVTVKQPGFNSITETGIVLHINERVVVDIGLTVGDVAQNVEVVAAAPLLQSESSTLGNVITRREVSELPLNGRSIYQLAYLNAGVTLAIPTQNANSTSIPDNARAPQGLSVNGQRQSNNVFILDGVYNNQINQGLIAILPPLEAVQEFVVETSNSHAEIGRGGGVVNVTLKSGTNQFHGQLFEYMRNAALDARNFFDQTFPRRLPNFVQNQFGGVLSGPIIKDKTFFMMDYQGFRQRQGQTFVVTIPGDAIRSGNFAGTARPIFDPNTYDAATNTRQPFPNMVIPQSRFNSATLNVMKFFPPSNDRSNRTLANGEALYFSGASVRRDQDSYDIKLDHRFSDRDSFSGRWSYGRSDVVLPGAFSGQYAPAVGGALGSGGAGFLNGYVSNPAESLGLQEIHNFNPRTINEFRAAYIRAGSDATQLGFGKNYANQLGIPNTNITADNTGFPSISISGYGLLGDSPFFPLIELENIYQLLDNVTFIRGSHTFKSGVDIKKVQRNFTQILGFPAGDFSFGTGFTSDPALPATTGNSFADFALGITDGGSETTTSGLAGIRSTEFSAYFQDTWKVGPKLTLDYGVRYDLFTPQTEQFNRQTNWDPIAGRLIQAGKGGGSLPGLNTRALVTTNKLNFSPRLGVAYKVTQSTVVRASFGLFFFPESQAGQQMTLNPPFVGGTSYTNTPEPQQINRTLDQGLPLTSPLIPIDNPVGGLNTRNPDNHTAYTQQWSLNVQRQLGGDFLLEVGYVGNHSVHLQDQWDLNQPFLGTGPVEQRRPFYATGPNLAGFTHVEQRGLANYDALQIQLTKRFSKGLSFLASYTWGKVIENASSNYGGPGHQDARNLNEDRGPAGIDLRQRFVTSWLYELPFGRGKQFLSNASGVVNQVVGGWQLGGVATVQTGLPFTVYGGAGRPNRICNGKLSNPTVNRWFDASCFVIPATVPDPVHGGVYIPFGNSGAYILSGPGVVDFDFSAFKSFRITETKRVEFRSEWFNAFNHAQFLYPDGTINDGTTGQIFNAKPSRQIQMVLKFLF